jgi:hypothetical protein
MAAVCDWARRGVSAACLILHASCTYCCQCGNHVVLVRINHALLRKWSTGNGVWSSWNTDHREQGSSHVVSICGFCVSYLWCLLSKQNTEKVGYDSDLDSVDTLTLLSNCGFVLFFTD